MGLKNIKANIENAERTYKNPKSEPTTTAPTPADNTPTTQQEEPQPQATATPEETTRKRVGRPRNRTFTKKNSIPLSVYFPADMKDTLESASFFGKVDQSDIVRAAVKNFIKEHTNGSQLKPSGLTIVRDYITETTVK